MSKDDELIEDLALNIEEIFKSDMRNQKIIKFLMYGEEQEMEIMGPIFKKMNRSDVIEIAVRYAISQSIVKQLNEESICTTWYRFMYTTRPFLEKYSLIKMEILEELEQTLDEALDYKFQAKIGFIGKLKKLFDTEENKHKRIKKLKMTTLIAEGINKNIQLW
jgi:hypothetical protein